MIGTILRKDKLMNKDTNQNRNSARNPGQEHNRRPNTSRAPSPNRPPKKDEKASYFSNEQKQTLKLVGVLTVCVIILLILSIALMNSFTTPTVNNEPKYIDIDNIEGMNVNEAIEILKKAEITYEIIPTDSKIPNRVEKLEYVGLVLSDTGRLRIRVGTNVKIYSNVVGKDKIIYLTFDDGPIVNYTYEYEIYHNTGEILDILNQYGVKASFFLVGNQMIKSDRSQYVRDIYDQGHTIACHSFSHNFDYIYESPSNFVSDVEQFENELKILLGEENYNSLGKYIRFPGGTIKNGYIGRKDAPEYLAAIREKGYKIYDWTVLTNDADNAYRLEGESDKEYYIRSLKETLENYKKTALPLIVLMHDKDSTKDALPEMLDFLISEGYYFDTIDNCPEYTDVEN